MVETGQAGLEDHEEDILMIFLRMLVILLALGLVVAIVNGFFLMIGRLLRIA
jgi:hypothetical protein